MSEVQVSGPIKGQVLSPGEGALMDAVNEHATYLTPELLAALAGDEETRLTPVRLKFDNGWRFTCAADMALNWINHIEATDDGSGDFLVRDICLMEDM